MADISYKDLIAPSFYGLWNDIIQKKYPEIWLAGGRGCVSGDTLLDTPSGKVAVKDFCGGIIFAFDGKRIVETYACRSRRYTKEWLYKVTTKSGKSILTTDEHRFLTPLGWRMTKELAPGETIETFSCDYQSRHSPSDVSCVRTAPCDEVLTMAYKLLLSISFSHFQKDSSALLETHCEGCQKLSHEDVLHLMRTLLGYLYHYWHDSRLCDGRFPLEGETYLDVVQQLADVPEHSHVDLQKDGLEHGERYIHLRHGSHPSKQDWHHHVEDKCCVNKESGNGQRRAVLPLESDSSIQQSHKSEDLVCSIQQVARLVLSSISHLGSLESCPCVSDVSVLPIDLKEDDILRMLLGMLWNKVHDESFSNLLIKQDKVTHTRHYTLLDDVKSIEKVRKEFYYDMFVPFYNNYIAQGFINHNSTKSSFVSTCIPLLMEMNPKIHCVCFRKYGTNLADSVYSQFEYTINEKLRPIADHWIFKRSPLKIVKADTGQQILFRGLDDPQKVKSLKAPFGYFGLIWFEELAEFDGIEEVRNVLQSLMRGGHYFQVLCSYNPPESTASWVNAEANTPQIVDGQLYRYVHHSDYRTVPKDWLGERFFQRAELLRQTNERAYRHEYLGEATGNGGAVFPNCAPLEMSDALIAQFDHRKFGLDWGFALDPACWIALHYDKTRRTIYIYDEIYDIQMTNQVFANLIKQKDMGYSYLMCDSAEPKSIAEFENMGINALPAQKGPDSVRFSTKWLSSLNHIYIDPQRCPNAWREFSQYEFEKNVAGQFISRYPDKNNHTIDACRYALMEDAIEAGLF